MEHFDSEKARRVWNRVQGRTSPALENRSFSDLISIKTQTAHIYQRLARYFRGQTGAVMQRFARQEQAHLAQISELIRLQSGQFPTMYTPISRKEPVQNLLQQCYGYKLQLLRIYEAYANTPYDGVFQPMIAQEQTQCQYLLKRMQRRP